MPYEIRHYPNHKAKCCKRNSKKCFSKKPLPLARAKKQMAALHAATNEALDLGAVGSNLRFKSAIKSPDGTKAAVYYRILSAEDADLILVYSVSPEGADYHSFVIKDHFVQQGRTIQGEDPLEFEKELKAYDLTPDDLEMAGQDGYDKIKTLKFGKEEEKADLDAASTGMEEGLQFEALYKKVSGRKK